MKTLFSLALAVALFSPLGAQAFDLVENAQCVGGTLVASHTDVIDGGGLGPYTNAKMMAAEDCALLTPAGGCCSAKVSTNGGGRGGPVIPYTWFNYQIFTGAQVQSGFPGGQTGPLANDPGAGRGAGRQFKYFAGPGGGAVEVSASLVANPTAISTGGQSLLSWSSTGAATCVGTNFSTNGATSGSVVVTPNTTTRYSITCSAASATPPPTIIDMNADGGSYQSNPKLLADFQTNGGFPFNSWYGIYSDVATTDRICKVIYGPDAAQAGFDVTKYKSPKNNQIVKWDGTKWVAFGARSDNRKIRYVFKCSVPGTVSTATGGSATAHATVQVSAVNTLSVSCRAHPGRAGFNEDVLWSSTVTGPAGTYAYSWTGTDSLSGTGNQVFTRYTTPGEKKAWLTVTYTPGTQTPPTPPSESPQPPRGTPTPPGGTGTLPPATACPAIGWVVPISPCGGTWVPSYDAGGCQSGWQCAAGTSGGGAALPGPASGGIIDTLMNFFQSDVTVPEEQQMNREPGAFWFSTRIAHAACTETVNTNQWYSGNAVPLASEGTSNPISCASFAADAGYTHWNRSIENRCPGVGSPCEYDPARTTCYGINASGPLISKPATNPPGGYPVRFDSGTVCGGNSCQNPTPTYNVQGASCAGGTVVGRTSEMLDGAQIGMWPDGWLASQCSELGAQAGDCCEYSQRASNNTGGGFPPNSYYQIRVIRGGSFSASESSYIQNPQCSGFNQNYSCSSVAGSVSTQCSGGPGDPPPPPPPPLDARRITVQCDNSVTVGTGDENVNQCTDGIDNDRDGRTDAVDPDCANGGRSEASVTTQCSDGIDNNGDGNVDFPDDPWCASANDNREAPDPIDMTLTGPALIKKNQSCTISLSARNVAACTLTGPGLSQGFTAVNGFVSASSVVTPALAQTSTYTLSCRGLDGKTAAKSVDCKVAPTFEEF
jgi:hypothetical protein